MARAPAFLKGIRPESVKDLLKNATKEQIQALQADSFFLWAATSGVKVDNNPFSFDDHRYLLPIYMDMSPHIVVGKAAQLGLTTLMLLKLVWYARFHNVKVAMYFPGGDSVRLLSKDRLNPLIASNYDLYSNMADSADSLQLKRIKNIHGGISSIYMLFLGSSGFKDSTPLDVLCFDEVRLCDQRDIDQAVERVSHSKYKIKMFFSTMGSPNEDIERRFNAGKQFFYHLACGCSSGFIPSEQFPNCVVDTGKEVYLRCSKCLYRVQDCQNGRYVAHNEKADYPSYHMSQFLSKYISVKEIWDAYKTTTNMREYYNSKLGRSFIDAENQPITQDVLDACIDNDLHWGYDISAPRDRKKACAMGVDQGKVCHAVIAKRAPNGRKEIVHMEIIDPANPKYWDSDGQPVSPFKRLYELMREFDVQICVLDAQPNTNEAQEFARYFPGRVYLAWYQKAGKEMVQWRDKARPKESIRKGGQEIKLKWQVDIQRYQIIDYTLRQFQEKMIKLPPPGKLIWLARNSETGRMENTEIVNDFFFKHLKSMVRNRKDLDQVDGSGGKIGNYKMEYIYIGGDPHFTHAMTYCMTALGRLARQAIFSL